jgi:hypothetical protein
MNISITFEESVKGCTKVNLYLFRLFSTKRSIHVRIVKEVVANLEPNLKNAELVRVQECKI